MIRRQDPAIGGGGINLSVSPSAITAFRIDTLPMHKDPGVRQTPRRGKGNVRGNFFLSGERESHRPIIRPLF